MLPQEKNLYLFIQNQTLKIKENETTHVCKEREEIQKYQKREMTVTH